MDTLELIKQNDPRFDIYFRREGCRARSLMAMSEFKVDQALNIDQLRECITKARANPNIMSSDATMGKLEQFITQFAFQELNESNHQFVQSGYHGPSGFVSWQGALIPTEEIAFVELHWETDYPAGHWTLGDASLNELWDPWSIEPSFNPFMPNHNSPDGAWIINKKRIIATYSYVFVE